MKITKLQLKKIIKEELSGVFEPPASAQHTVSQTSDEETEEYILDDIKDLKKRVKELEKETKNTFEGLVDLARATLPRGGDGDEEMYNKLMKRK